MRKKEIGNDVGLAVCVGAALGLATACSVADGSDEPLEPPSSEIGQDGADLDATLIGVDPRQRPRKLDQGPCRAPGHGLAGASGQRAAPRVEPHARRAERRAPLPTTREAGRPRRPPPPWTR
ncbi:MAG TPA: hypothetical protein VL242_44325 [Sorangium sp.]|nr:hypothetical protein [Sorangium sp.]